APAPPPEGQHSPSPVSSPAVTTEPTTAFSSAFAHRTREALSCRRTPALADRPPLSLRRSSSLTVGATTAAAAAVTACTGIGRTNPGKDPATVALDSSPPAVALASATPTEAAAGGRPSPDTSIHAAAEDTRSAKRAARAARRSRERSGAVSASLAASSRCV
ncbi:unnamed protein product, partial [Ectocarpus sp. 12 AP-2014]